MDAFNQNRERARLVALHERMHEQLDDYLSDAFEGVALHSAGCIFALDQATAGIFGYRIEEVLYRNAIDFFPAQSSRVMLQQMICKSPDTYTVTARHKNGSQFPLQMQRPGFRGPWRARPRDADTASQARRRHRQTVSASGIHRGYRQ